MAVTPWNDSLQAQENVLIVSLGDLADLNTGEFGGGGTDVPDWFADVLARGDWGRTGNFVVREVVGGSDVIGGASCAWGHAVHGDDGEQLWNGTGTDPDDTSAPVCALLGGGDPEPALNGTAATYELSYFETDLLVSAFVEATIHMRMQAIWLLAAKANLTERGVLSLAGVDPVADGAPEDAELEWEGELELLGVEVAGDVVGRPAEGTVLDEDAATFFFNDDILPEMVDGVWGDVWEKGEPGEEDGTGRTWRLVTYKDGDPDWTELPEYASWADCQPLDGDLPDQTLGIAIARALGSGVPDLDTLGSNSSEIALRLTLRSPRYRWVYAGANPVIRQYPRDDGRGLSSAPRLYPPTKAGRLAGGYQ